MPEYGVELPLWSEEGLVEQDLGLTKSLIRDLVAWSRYFERHFRYDAGWDEPAHSAHFAHVASGLEERLRSELGPDVQVSSDLWPLESDRD